MYYLVKINKPELFELGPGEWHRMLNHKEGNLREVYFNQDALEERLIWIYKSIDIHHDEIKRRAKSLWEWAAENVVIVVNRHYAIHDYRLLDVAYHELRKFIGIHHNKLYLVTGGFRINEKRGEVCK